MLQPRRRRLPLTPVDNVNSSWKESHEGNIEKRKNRKVRKRRKRQRRAGARRCNLLWAVISAALVVSLWKTRRKLVLSFEPGHISLRKGTLRAIIGSDVSSIPEQLEHGALYDAVRQSSSRHDEAAPSYEKHAFNLTSSYGTDVTKEGCNLTVVFMDPRLATAGQGDSAWFSLESVAAFSPDACILLQTGTSLYIRLVHLISPLLIFMVLRSLSL